MAQNLFGHAKRLLDSKVGKGCPFGVKIGEISSCSHAGPGCKVDGWEKICGAPDVRKGLTLSRRLFIQFASWFD